MGIIPRFGVFVDVENGRECPVYRGFWGFGGVLGCARGVLVWGMGLAVPLWAFLSLWGGGWGV